MALYPFGSGSADIDAAPTELVWVSTIVSVRAQRMSTAAGCGSPAAGVTNRGVKSIDGVWGEREIEKRTKGKTATA